MTIFEKNMYLFWQIQCLHASLINCDQRLNYTLSNIAAVLDRLYRILRYRESHNCQQVQIQSQTSIAIVPQIENLTPQYPKLRWQSPTNLNSVVGITHQYSITAMKAFQIFRSREPINHIKMEYNSQSETIVFQQIDLIACHHC